MKRRFMLRCRFVRWSTGLKWIAVAVAFGFGSFGPTVVAAELITNGDFEAPTAGAFGSWTATDRSAAASASAAPTVIGGNHSAQLLSRGGSLLQTVDTDGICHFVMEMDFAVLDAASTGVRSFGVVKYSTTGVSHSGSDNIDSIRVYTTAVPTNNPVLVCCQALASFATLPSPSENARFRR